MFALKREMKKKKEFAPLLLRWFKSNKRDFQWRRETDPYRILVAEKLLQQTTFGQVRKVYGKFLKKYPDIETLAGADAKDIEETIKPLGFHRQRATQFKRMTLKMMAEHSGKVPSNREDLLKLNGIGDYVANAVLCFAFNKDEPIVDMNVRRVVRRYFFWKQLNDEEIKERLRPIIPKSKAKEFNWGIIDFSSLICSRKPKCKICFLNDLCSYFNKQ